MVRTSAELGDETYHEYQSSTEVLLKEELSRILQFPLSLWKQQQMGKPELKEVHRPARQPCSQEDLTRTGSTRRPGGREDRFMAAIFCRVSTAAGMFPAETLYRADSGINWLAPERRVRTRQPRRPRRTHNKP